MIDYLGDDEIVNDEEEIVVLETKSGEELEPK